ncbi:regulatory protein RecX [Candidatus Saccharibacteria bacterium]|nr:regulatory protein RecX [Candidatus Saccharibacteria bacterium]
MDIININGISRDDYDPEDSSEADLPFSKAKFGGSVAERDPHVITDMRPALHAEDRVNIYLGGNFAFSLDISQVVDYHLKIGKTLTASEIKELESASEFGKLYSSTLEWVLARPRSIRETRERLAQKLTHLKFENEHRRQNAERLSRDPSLAAHQKELKIQTRERKLYTHDDIEKVISRLIEKNYLNDERFARWYVENRFVKKGISRLRLKEELNRKGIDKELISELLDSSGRTEEEEIKKVIRKKAPHSTSTKVLRALVSRGFSFELSRELLEQYEENPEDF